jgi:DNA-binding MarR family transcriptional regulator
MPITSETVDRLTSSISQLLRVGRHVSVRAAGHLYGELPPFGWGLLIPLERDGDQRCSALAAHAGVDVSVASRQLAVLERLGYVERRPDPQDGRAALLRLTDAGADALTAARTLRSDWALTALVGWDEADARQLSGLLDRLVADLESAGIPASAAAHAAVPNPR